MKLVSFNYQDQDRIGIMADDVHIVDVGLAWQSEISPPTDMLAFIELGQSGRQLAERALHSSSEAAYIRTEDVSWLPPVPRPGKICGVALNNSSSNSRKISAPDHPAFFLKPSSCLAGHLQPLKMRTYYGSMHPEPELALVIGKKTRDVDARDAHAYIYGYAIFNDITGNGMRAEDLFHYHALYASEKNPNEIEKREQHLSYAGRYKGTDNFGVLGPWLVTADEVENPDDLNVTCKVNGEIVAEDSTRFYNYKVAEIVSYISQFHTLFPGDVIACGTAFKTSQNRKSIHHANLLVTGGPVEITIDNLGTQVSPVIIEKREIGRWRLT